jgi:hypothetical protein
VYGSPTSRIVAWVWVAVAVILTVVARLASAWYRSPDWPLSRLNEHRTKPFISDNVGLIAGVLIAAAAVAAWHLAVWLSRKQSRLSEPRA